MGCCLSKNHDFNNTPPSPFPPKAHLSVVKPPPLSPVSEEESVKEVLSETPTPKPQTQTQTQTQTKPPALLKIEEEAEEEDKHGPEEKKKKKKKNPTTPTIPTAGIPSVSKKKIEQEKKVEVLLLVHNHNVPAAASEEISEVSEICSLSESISTTTITERKDESEDGEVQQRLVQRSPAKLLRKRSIPGEFVGKHERGSKSPARRLNPSPGRRHHDNFSDLHNNQTAAARRRISENNRVRRDPGDRSGRRSRSPATRVNSGTTRAGVGRSPSRRAQPPRSPARVPVVAPEKVEEEKKEVKEETSTTNESMENPLVSMECFIFL